MPSSTTTQTPSLSSNRAQSALMEGLAPPLRNTLSSLNINLDYELARYRYAKRGEAPPSASPPQFQARRRSLNLINVPPTPQSSPATRAVAPPPPPNPRLQRPEAPLGTSQRASEVAALRSAIVQRSMVSPETGLASSAARLQDFDAPGSSPRQEPSLESPARSWTTSIMTPLGLGALMLLLVASAGFGFLLVNPSAASQLFQNTPLARFFPNEADADAIAEATTETEDEAIAEWEGPPLTELGPDLSQREFADLDLNNLSTLPSSSADLSPGTEALTANDPADSDGTNVEQTPAESAAIARESTTNEPQRVSQMPTRTTPAPQPAAPTYTAPAPAPAAAPTPPPIPAAERPTQPAPPSAPATPASREPVSSYYVVTDYTGDPSLDAARSAVGEAYVRNFDVGARIQMGAFNTPGGAAALAEELRNQGIEAEIYEP